MRCVCGGGPAHHRIEPECWCPACLRKPEAERCTKFDPVREEPIRQANVRKSMPKAGSLRRQVLDMIAKRNGCTDDELEYMTGRSHQSVSAVRNSLMNDGWVYDSGERRRNRYGNDSIVWKWNP